MKIQIGNKTFEVSKEALESNPNEIKLDFDGTLRTSEEESVFIENQKKEARKEGIEIAVKQYRDEFGFQGRTLDKLIEAVKAKTLEDAKIEPEEQLKKLQQTIQEKETALQSALGRIGEKENELTSFKKNIKLDKFLDGVIPEKTLLPKDDMKLILKTKLKFDFDENENIVTLDSNGNVIKDPTTANPKQAKDVVDLFFKENQNYLTPISGGAGGEDSKSGGKKKSIDDFIKEQKDKGVKLNTPEFNENLKKQVEAGLVEVE